jgi:hypothetical protein
MLNNFVKYSGKISTKTMNIINQEQYTSVLENLNLVSNDIIMDIGFGNGYLIKNYSKEIVQ